MASQFLTQAVFDKFKRVDITDTHYRGIRFDVKRHLCKKYRHDSTLDFIGETP